MVFIWGASDKKSAIFMSDGPVFSGKEQVTPPPYLLVKCAGDAIVLRAFTGSQSLFIWKEQMIFGYIHNNILPLWN